MAKAAFNRKKTLVTSKLDFSLRTVDEKYVESFEMCYWRRMDKISWTDHLKIEEVLRRNKDEINILHTVTRGKSNCSGHNFLRNCVLKHFIEGKI